MKTIYKYVIDYEAANIASFNIPLHSKFRSLQVQHDKPVLYFEVESLNKTSKQDFLLAETGATIPSGVVYIGTVMLLGGSCVLHVYWYKNSRIIMLSHL
jgi:hypothetical protein